MLAAILFTIGLAGVLVRRNLLFMLMSLEIMLNAAGLAFVAAGAQLGSGRRPGHVALRLPLAAAEVAVGLGARHSQLHRRDSRHLDIDAVASDGLRGVTGDAPSSLWLLPRFPFLGFLVLGAARARALPRAAVSRDRRRVGRPRRRW